MTGGSKMDLISSNACYSLLNNKVKNEMEVYSDIINDVEYLGRVFI